MTAPVARAKRDYGANPSVRVERDFRENWSKEN